MVTREEFRCIALSLPGVQEDPEHFSFAVPNRGKLKGLAWVWLERIHPKKARIPNPEVMAVLVPDLTSKEVILSSDSEKYFTEAHYNNYPAVLVRLAAVTREDVDSLLFEAWRCKAGKEFLLQLADRDVPGTCDT